MEKKELINLLKECGAIEFGRFILTSGAVSNYYIDIKKASTNPHILKKIAKAIAEYAKGYDIIAGMELGAVPLAVAVSLETEIPYVIIRKEKREHGTGKQIEGGDVKGKKVLIVEDVTTSGGSVIKSVSILRENEAIVDEVIAVVDRESGTKEKLKKLDINFIPLLSVSDILKKFKLSRQP
jgi:orotate phosphoribosyltransferase